MDNEKKQNNKFIIYYVIFTVILSIIGFLVIPKFIKKYGNKLYKASLKNEDIDFENLGPEIVKKDNAK